MIPGSGRSPRKENGYLTLVFLSGEFCGQKSLVGYSPRGCKESEVTEQLTLPLLPYNDISREFSNTKSWKTGISVFTRCHLMKRYLEV